jgi:tetratricopeptide (TPR) repeat protein
VVALAAASSVPRVLRACGPYFALEILPSRDSVALNAPSAPSVTDGLVPQPGDRLPVGEVAEGGDEASRMERAEAEGLPAQAAARIKAMREQSDGDAAYAVGEGLPEAVRAYTAGAVSYRHQQFDKAQHYFERVLALNPGEGAREQRAVWASFMLGKIARQQGNSEAAAASWATTRGLVRSGLRDPLGLAVASFGEEARLYLQSVTLAKAVALYARQAAYGSQSGRWSLLLVAEQIISDPALLDEGVADPLTRRLVLRYVYARSSGASFAENGPAPALAPPMLDRVLDAFERHRVSDVEGADLLAASAYAGGRFEVAARLATYQTSPLSAWINGKLALRRGDRSAALASLSDAVKGLAPHPAARSQAQAEAGLLRVSSGEFALACELFFGAVGDRWSGHRRFSDYWADLAYLAERVLTLDELLPIVDRLAPPPSPTAVKAAAEHEQELPATKLREIAARRLMRAGRYREALRYFDADQHLHQVAENYMDAVTTARNRWRSRGTRAEAWFTAATIARHDGMELLGFELEPDFAMYDGMYDPGAMRAEGRPSDETVRDPNAAAVAALTAATPEERSRAAASKPAAPVRFHYRLTAVDHALASADLVPRSSQAFAAILCRATEWIIDREPRRAAAIYARYVHEGPRVAWASHFGRDCPAPDFDGAEHRRRQERMAAATWIFRRHPRRVAAAAVSVVTLGVAWIAWRRGALSRIRQG